MRVINKTGEVRWYLDALPIAHVAYLLDRGYNGIIRFFKAVEEERGAAIIENALSKSGASVLSSISAAKAAAILNKVSAPKAASIFEEFGESSAEEIWHNLSESKRSVIGVLLSISCISKVLY